jgi:hypothetical protein
LVDALGSGPSARKGVEVQVLFCVKNKSLWDNRLEQLIELLFFYAQLVTDRV